MTRLVLTCALIGIGGVGSAFGDQFEALDGKTLLALTRGGAATTVVRLGYEEMGALPSLLKESRAALFVATTAKGNVVRLLVAPEQRKAEDPTKTPSPVFMLERFDTFDGADLSARVARGREIVLFRDFEFDLDTGQVVPPGQGGDIAFRAEDGLALVAIDGAKLSVVNRLPAADASRPPQPTPGRAVLPGDFAGRYRLVANGQWAGTLDLNVEPKGEVSGRFRSETHGASYPVTGQLDPAVANKVALTVKFPRSSGELEGYLWTEGKGAMAGTFRLADRTYGFFALREGARFAPESGTALIEPDEPGRSLQVQIVGGTCVLDGKPYGSRELTEAIRVRLGQAAPPSLTLSAEADTAYALVLSTIEAARAAGVSSIHLAPLDPAASGRKP